VKCLLLQTKIKEECKKNVNQKIKNQKSKIKNQKANKNSQKEEEDLES